MDKKSADSPSKQLETFPDFSREEQLYRQGLHHVAGVDEVGRGPLAGPVVVAAVILDPAALPAGLDDSKRLTARRREALYGPIMESALSISVASLSATSIDTHNILQATLEGMRRAIAGLALKPDYALIDGRDVPRGLLCPALAVIKGDQHSLSIAAASIIAKVTRDRMLERVGRLAPIYGFEKHAGYGTAQHRAAITEAGPLLRIHRMSFAPMRPE